MTRKIPISLLLTMKLSKRGCLWNVNPLSLNNEPGSFQNMIDEMYSLNTSPKVRFPDRIHATEILDTMTTQGEKEGMDHEEGNNKINRETTPTQNKGLKRNIKERLTVTRSTASRLQQAS